jgi:SAM-dependent methyltransferase
MSFSSNWLALREPADRAARDGALAAALGDWAAARTRALGRPLLVVDLGCGTGASHRALSPLLPGARWRLTDNDPALLAEAAGRTGAHTLCLDLAATPEIALDGADIVTASALFDLASAAWIDRLAGALAPGAAMLAALSYDGIETWDPADPAEAEGLAAFHAHQVGDKGFGPSLGPGGAAYLAQALARGGREVRRAPSPWRLSRSRDGALIEALADGAAGAAAQAAHAAGAAAQAAHAADAAAQAAHAHGTAAQATGADGAQAARTNGGGAQSSAAAEPMSPQVHARWAAARRAAETVVIGHEDVLALPRG